MKTCSYCGRENEEIRQRCFECGTELPDVPLSASPTLVAQPGERQCVFCGARNPAAPKVCGICSHELLEPEHPATDDFRAGPEAAELPRLELEYETAHGFSYPDWKGLWERVSGLPAGEWHASYRQAARQWLQQLRADLGGNYRCYETGTFLLLCAEGRQVSQVLLAYAEKSQEAIARQLGHLFPREVYGPQVLLVFSDADDYYTYVAHFYPDGTHSQSTGIFITAGGYSHIAMPFTYVFSAKQVLTHELVHNSLMHLRVPAWLNEGLAQRLEQVVMAVAFSLDRETAGRHRMFWDADRIQKFWAGVSFHEPGESVELSYNLGLIIVELLVTEYAAFLEFVSQADWRDGGQDAAVRLLDKDLGAVVAGLLGPGDWRPNRKRINELLKSQAQADD